jgi:hypothetical protein
MRQDETFPQRVSDPAAEGLPEYADDDSTANDDVDSPRWADGPSPAPLPADRETGPYLLDDFGTTAEEQRRGEPLTDRLNRELPDVSPDDLPIDGEPPDAVRGLTDEATDEAAVEQVGTDAAVLFGDVAEEPHLDSPVSMYDRPGLDPVTEGRVGRLVQPDEGVHGDQEKDEVAYDAGAAGGGASAEELAMHEFPEDA